MHKKAGDRKLYSCVVEGREFLVPKLYYKIAEFPCRIFIFSMA